MTIISATCAGKMAARKPVFAVVAIMVGLVVISEVGAAYDPEASITGLYTGPYFDPLAPRNLTAHLGDRAELPCTVRQLGDKSVSWVRMRDADILTVDRYTFVGDERFEAHYSIPAETWNLIINYVQERDAGDYECQVSTEPKMSQFFNLRVVVPQVNIDPPGDRHVKSGSKVRIDCHITDVVQIPDYIFWYHDNVRVLDRTDQNLDVTVTRTGEESIMSSLHIERVRKDQSGNYTCMPSNLHAAFTLLHVLNEEHPAAMQDGRNQASQIRLSPGLVALVVFLLVVAHLETAESSSQQVLSHPKSNPEEWFSGKGEQSDSSQDAGNPAENGFEGQVELAGSKDRVAKRSERVVALVKRLLESSNEDQVQITSLLVNEVPSNELEGTNVSHGLRYITDNEMFDQFQPLGPRFVGANEKMFPYPTEASKPLPSYLPNASTNEKSPVITILDKAYSSESQHQNHSLDHTQSLCSTVAKVYPVIQSAAAPSCFSARVVTVRLVSR